MRPIRGETIRLWMDANGYTREQLAGELGITDRTIYNWQRRGAPRILGLALRALEPESSVDPLEPALLLEDLA